ncbi:hypothetical protein [Pantoea agglomerans]|uniref:hypothetical protein n=1 Tax=Enterobacter agglomerans TaxID=549 RepID=UPI001375E55E|nr:hypothetical protein [Pantoea agglomerans]MBD8144764.1 hypothetical protein [Pantoea agglomerans]MBD8222465.1 hypothetical protein [Pantoea agglomerans]WNK56119.1 hypothetical protein RM154_22615 [Pantoea agglomerans]WNK74078.1 hypothetical protein RM155_22530 [Pantoea agglomerans]WVL82824.1 hypothetical protein IFT78_022885 [Pantoea agglomerans]
MSPVDGQALPDPLLLTVAESACHVLLKPHAFQQYKKQHFAEYYRMNFILHAGFVVGEI